MTAPQFPTLGCDAVGQSGSRQPVARQALPDWPRLMNERLAASYLSIGTTMLREKGPTPKKIGGRTVWDRHDLDRFADALDGQPLDRAGVESHSRTVERAWMEGRDNRKKAANG